jgi:putative SOS response-associated peptidase YedK
VFSVFRKLDEARGAMRGMMCSRYALWAVDDLGGRFLIVDPTIGFRSHFNIAPRSENPVVVSAEGRNRIRLMQWGLVPHWAKDSQTMPRPVNARAESLSEKPMFRQLLKENRCLVPANGFYEWKKEGSRKVPFFFHRPDNALFSFAGLYDAWQSSSGETLVTYTIITTSANELMAPVHDRMPVVLAQEGEERWLSSGPRSPDELREILVPCADDVLEVHMVSQRVNRPGEDDEGMILPVNGQGTIGGERACSHSRGLT